MSRIIALLTLGILSFVATACDKVPLLAPTDSTISMSVNSTTLPLSGTAQVTAVVLESSGTAPQNGTVVTFTTTLGHVDPVEARTTNGLAQTTFHAGTRSGTATIRGFSGGATGGETDSSIDVFVGGAAENILVTLRVEGTSNGGSNTNLVARVDDGVGNAVTGIAVSFTTNRGQLTRGLEITDGNGEARTTLITSEAATVVARAGAAASDSIEINAPGSLTLAFGAGSTTPPFEVGQLINFTVTPSGTTFFTNVAVDFGDGTPIQNLGNVSAVRNFNHTYTQRGNFTVTVTGTTPNGTVTDSLGVTVNDRGPLQVGLTAAPNPVGLVANQGLTILTATATTTGGAAPAIARVEWTFGDNQNGQGTSLAINHRYSATGTFVASVRVIATDGREGTASTTVRVVP